LCRSMRWSDQRPKAWTTVRNTSGAGDLKTVLFIKRQILFIECFDIARAEIPIRCGQHRGDQCSANQVPAYGRLCPGGKQVPVQFVGQLPPDRFEIAADINPTSDVRPAQLEWQSGYSLPRDICNSQFRSRTNP